MIDKIQEILKKLSKEEEELINKELAKKERQRFAFVIKGTTTIVTGAVTDLTETNLPASLQGKKFHVDKIKLYAIAQTAGIVAVSDILLASMRFDGRDILEGAGATKPLFPVDFKFYGETEDITFAASNNECRSPDFLNIKKCNIVYANMSTNSQDFEIYALIGGVIH